mmetsp:Transcript_19566/g.57009  ORF Transcript_19566/g.57009 Transcript_19566/m.57009 type:complete len:225 (-) Transcript_19566:1506-2180(-)
MAPRERGPCGHSSNIIGGLPVLGRDDKREQGHLQILEPRVPSTEHEGPIELDDALERGLGRNGCCQRPSGRRPQRELRRQDLLGGAEGLRLRHRTRHLCRRFGVHPEYWQSHLGRRTGVPDLARRTLLQHALAPAVELVLGHVRRVAGRQPPRTDENVVILRSQVEDRLAAACRTGAVASPSGLDGHADPVVLSRKHAVLLPIYSDGKAPAHHPGVRSVDGLAQ